MFNSINTLLTPLEDLIRKYQRYIGYFLLLLAALSIGFLFDARSVKNTGGLASTMLWILLWIPIFARVFGISLFTTILPLRKQLGILMGTLAVVHGFSYLIPYGETMQIFTSDGQPTFLFFGLIAMWLSIPLTLTSSSWAMRRLGKNWKRLHRLVYGVALFTILHIALIRGYKYMDFGPIIFFSIYLGFKVLEWRGYSFAKKENKVYLLGQKWLCVPCGYIYDPVLGDEEDGIPAGTEFSDIPDDWRCPECGVTKADFVPFVDGQEIATHVARAVHAELINPTTLELIIETQEHFPSSPGQFMSFLWHDDEGEFLRSYSIAAQVGNQFTFLIKLDDKGRGARILRHIGIDADIHIKGVFGNFLLQDGNSPKVFIATGTGLAPIYCMITALPVEMSKSLYFTVSTESELFYVEKLRQIANLDLHIHVSREEIEGYEFGRVDVDAITAIPDTEWYLCGNPRMVTEAKEKLAVRGMGKIYSEEFN